jgi:hypothetical protein
MVCTSSRRAFSKTGEDIPRGEMQDRQSPLRFKVVKPAKRRLACTNISRLDSLGGGTELPATAAGLQFMYGLYLACSQVVFLVLPASPVVVQALIGLNICTTQRRNTSQDSQLDHPSHFLFLYTYFAKRALSK